MTSKISRHAGSASRLDQRRRSAAETLNESYSAKQREIVHAAVRLFAEKGYNATNFIDIADAVNMDRATVYYYFKSKTHLLASTITDVFSGAAKELDEIVASNANAVSKLRGAIRCIVTAMDEQYPFSALYFQDDIWRSPRNATWIASLRDDGARIAKTFTTIIEEGQREGAIRDDVPAELVSRIVFGSLSWTYRWLKPGCGYATDEVIRSFDAILSEGVAPPKKARPRRHH